MEESSNSLNMNPVGNQAGGSEPGVNQAGGSEPGGNQPGGNQPGGSGSDLHPEDSSERRRRKDMANYLENLLNKEIESRSSIDPRFANKKVTIGNLNIVNFQSNPTLPGTGEAERYIIEYRKNYPDAFLKNAPGRTLVKKLIDHLNNNNNN
jgi:hypothetical protein